MSGKLTTHVLDTSIGAPAKGIQIDLKQLDDVSRGWIQLGSSRTNGDGRLNEPLLKGVSMQQGTYELTFHAGDYYSGTENPGFLDLIPVRFVIHDNEAHYHVPLLLSPGGYTTYRGS